MHNKGGDLTNNIAKVMQRLLFLLNTREGKRALSAAILTEHRNYSVSQNKPL